LDIWQGGVEATGGALSLDKCSWSGLFYFFQAGQWKLHSSQTYPAVLTIRDGLQVLPLKRYEPDEAVKVVGVHQSLSGSMAAQIISLTEKSDAWATAILQGHLDRKIFWQGLHTMIWPSLRYPLAVSSISERAATRITKQLFKALLPKLGANRSYLTDLCFTPWHYSDLDYLTFTGSKVPLPSVSSLKLAMAFQLTLISYNVPWNKLN